jgi:hypothetical protein
MSQNISQSEEDPEKRIPSQGRESETALIQRKQAAYELSRGYTQVITSEVRIYFALATLVVVLLMAATVAVGATWLFPPVYVGMVITYIAGALYLFKKLWTF